MQKWEVELLRKVEGQWQVIRHASVYEYDGDCADANVFYKALDEFGPNMEAWDVIRTSFGSTQLRIDENGESHYIKC